MSIYVHIRGLCFFLVVLVGLGLGAPEGLQQVVLSGILNRIFCDFDLIEENDLICIA